jgi:hypothetical protein
MYKYISTEKCIGVAGGVSLAGPDRRGQLLLLSSFVFVVVVVVVCCCWGCGVVLWWCYGGMGEMMWWWYCGSIVLTLDLRKQRE